MTTVDLDALPSDFDPTDPELLAERMPQAELLAMRRTSPVHWVEQDEAALAGFPGHSGYWAISRHADVAEVSKNQDDFSTHENGVIVRFSPDATREDVEQTRFLLINHDGDAHTQLRRIVSRAFTPRAINGLHDELRARAEAIVEAALQKETGNFVADVAAELPLQAIAELLGIPQEERHQLFDWTNQMMSYEDPDVPGDQMTAYAEILSYSMAMADERRRNPQDDIVSKLVTADVEGRGLTDDEFGFFVILLAVAGNETTRNAITHGMKAFLDNPDQWELYKRERPDTAADEIIRWATPITVFQRTALSDVEIGGRQVRQGDRVGLLYASANFDEDVFTDPFRFDITRDPNPHQAFGGHGAHYCIGANLARLEIKLIFDVLADRDPDIRLLGEPRKLRSSWVNGIKDLPVAYH